MTKSGIAALTIGILLVLGALRGIDLWSSREQTLNAAEARAANLSYMLAEYVRQSFAAGDASLRQLVVHSQRIGGADAPDAEWMPSMMAARVGLQDVGSISVTDRSGRVVHSTQPAIVGQLRADDFAFRRLSAATDDALIVSAPFMTITEPHRYIIPIARRLTRPDGTFDGIVVATFLPVAPAFFRTVDVGQRGIVWAFHPDGAVIYQQPSSDNPVGHRSETNPLFQLAQRTGASGRFIGPVEPNGPVYVSAVHVLPTPPLYVAVSLHRDEALADWRRQARILLAVSAVVGGTMIATLLALFRQIDAKAQALQAALESEQRARIASEETGRLKEEFLMTVSHELRTPLQSILGWTRVLLGGGLSDPRMTRNALETIERNVGVQTTLINDLLDVSRGVSGKLRLEIKTVDLAEVVRHVVETSRPAADAKAIALSAAIGEIPAISGDPERLQQIIWNLVSNAIKFTADGGSVRIQLARAGGQVELLVSDTGIGIAPEFLPYVFERFRQADGSTTRRFGGLGLGLAIVRHLVELHGGSVAAESAGEGKGATFRVRLPIRPAATYTDSRDDHSASARA